ncbi:MAG: hypothetical protein C3F07_16055 [Anaerolineales bacterium]|nr:MAG: hypothetical protein C3F07_16055 [Anaerolineales bacterium]
MELKDILTLYRRWWWLLLLGLTVGLASGYTASRIQTPVYEASAKVLVTRNRQQGNADIFSMSDQQLVLTYLQLLKTRPVLQEVGRRVGVLVDEDNVKVEIIADTQIIQIKVQDTEAARAAAIANELIQVLIEQNELLQAGRYTTYEQGLNSQISLVQEQINALQSQISEINQENIDEQLDLVNRQITDLQNQISTLEQEINGFPSLLSSVDRARLTEMQSQLGQLRSLLALYQEIQTNLVFLGKPSQGTGAADARITGLQATLSLYQQLYLNLLSNLEAVKLARAQSTPTVTKIEEAAVPQGPIRPIPVLYTALSGMVGLLIAAGAILLKDYLDDTLQSSQKIREMLGLPVLAEIVHESKPDQNGSAPSARHPNSPFLNAFGILRINVSRLMAQNPQRSILVTSGSLGEGKTTIALNLAKAFTQAGKKTILLDADFYKPMLHTRLGLENKTGLTDLLGDGLDWQAVVQDCEGLYVITSGHHPRASVVQLESNGMTKLLKHLQTAFDIIIFDGPPLFIVDSQVLSSQLGGILLVVRQANTSAAAVRTMLEQLKLMGVNILGVVLNRVPRADTYYYGGYYGGYFGDNHKAKEEDEPEIEKT